VSWLIEIRHVKNLVALDFEIPGPGVYVLTGENGAGKTSLLACLARVGIPDAFPRHFKTSNASTKLDIYIGATVSYVSPDPTQSVTYAYSGVRWEPAPKKNGATLLANIGYSQVLYIAADGARVTPRREDFKPNKITPASHFISSKANLILGTSKFDDLKTVNVRRGKGQQAFVIEYEENEYVSERNFSLGELAVLKLLRALEKAPDKSLAIIDELELALHPLAQERLLAEIKKIAKEKALTVVFSTHSATLIGTIDRQHLLFLERQGKKVVCVRGCYPTYALGRMAPTSDHRPEVVLLVEDAAAERLIRSSLRHALKTLNLSSASPTIAVMPIGPYDAVLRFLDKSSSIFSPQTRVTAFLDQDCIEALDPPTLTTPPAAGFATSPTVIKPAAKANFDLQKLYHQIKKNVAFLSVTPEVGVVNALAISGNDFLVLLMDALSNNSILSVPLPLSVGSTNDPTARSNAKTSLDRFSDALHAKTGKSREFLLDQIFDWYVESLEIASPGCAASVLAPRLN